VAFVWETDVCQILVIPTEPVEDIAQAEGEREVIVVCTGGVRAVAWVPAVSHLALTLGLHSANAPETQVFPSRVISLVQVTFSPA
jgi:hypothetical protein